MTKLTQSGEFSKAELPPSTLCENLSKAKEIFSHLKWSAHVEEYLSIERFLFTNSFFLAWESGFGKEKREKFDNSLYFRQLILQTVYSCDCQSLDQVKDCLNSILSELDGELDGELDKNIQSLIDHLFEELRVYYTSDCFDNDQDRGDLILLYHQEIERFFNDIKPVLHWISKKSE
jgi:flagellin-specific chaperone FliS